jgi:hypothetical protein
MKKGGRLSDGGHRRSIDRVDDRVDDGRSGWRAKCHHGKVKFSADDFLSGLGDTRGGSRVTLTVCDFFTRLYLRMTRETPTLSLAPLWGHRRSRDEKKDDRVHFSVLCGLYFSLP